MPGFLLSCDACNFNLFITFILLFFFYLYSSVDYFSPSQSKTAGWSFNVQWNKPAIYYSPLLEHKEWQRRKYCHSCVNSIKRVLMSYFPVQWIVFCSPSPPLIPWHQGLGVYLNAEKWKQNGNRRAQNKLFAFLWLLPLIKHYIKSVLEEYNWDHPSNF